MFSTWRLRIDVVLHNCCSDHGTGSKEETDCHTLDRSKNETHLAEARVDDVVQKWNHDDDRDRIEVLDDIVRYSA